MTLEERLAVLEDRMERLLDLLTDDAIDGADEPVGPDDYDSPLWQIKNMLHLPFGYMLPPEIEVDWTAGIAESKLTAAKFLGEPGRDSDDLTDGEYWWCIYRGYVALRSSPETDSRSVGVDPDGLRGKIRVAALLGPGQQAAFNMAWYYGQLSGPKSTSSTEPFVWPDWLPDPR